MAIDLCIRHSLVTTLEALLFPLPEGSSAGAGVASDKTAISLLEEVTENLVALGFNHIEGGSRVRWPTHVQVDHLEATDPMGLASRAKGPAEEAILVRYAFDRIDGTLIHASKISTMRTKQHGGGSLPSVAPTLRRVALFLSSHKR